MVKLRLGIFVVVVIVVVVVVVDIRVKDRLISHPTISVMFVTHSMQHT